MDHPSSSEVYLALGGSGGSRIFGAVAQTLLNLDWGYDLANAVEQPRVHHQLLPAYVGDEMVCIALARFWLQRLTPVAVYRSLSSRLSGRIWSRRFNRAVTTLRKLTKRSNLSPLPRALKAYLTLCAPRLFDINLGIAEVQACMRDENGRFFGEFVLQN